MDEETKRWYRCNVGQKIQKYDQFGQYYNLKIEAGRTVLTSAVGGLCSFVLMLLTLAYFGYKMSVLVGKTNVNLVKTVQENYYDKTYIFDADKGLNFAVGVYDGYSAPEYI